MAERSNAAQEALQRILAHHHGMREAEAKRRLEQVARAAAIADARAAGMTLEEIAHALQVTKQRVTQMAVAGAK